MKYKKGYKYQLVKEEVFRVPELAAFDYKSYFISLINGKLTLARGYAWNGMSWWPDSKKTKRGSGAHDALYQLISENVLKPQQRLIADQIFLRILKEDKYILSSLCYAGVRKLGKSASTKREKVYTAP